MAHQPTNDHTTPTLSHCYQAAGPPGGLPGGPSDPDNDPDGDLPNLFNNKDSLPPSPPDPHGIPLPDSLPS